MRRYPASVLLNKRKGRRDAFHAAYPAGDIRRRLRFTFSNRAQQEHFPVLGGDFHVRGFHLIAGQQLGTYFGGDPYRWTHRPDRLAGPDGSH